MQSCSFFFLPLCEAFIDCSLYLGRNLKCNSSHHLLRVTVSFSELFLKLLLVWWNGSDLSVVKTNYPSNTNKQLQNVEKCMIFTAFYTVHMLSITFTSGFHLLSVLCLIYSSYISSTDCLTNLKICQQANSKRSQQHSLNLKYKCNRFKSI